jgi:exopolyphosphatase/guanosine-5'-triphosphate,3'-diphosphate pyrophosphatase
LRFARSCGVDLQHTQHVAVLCVQLFDQLAGPFQLNAGDRPLLEAAALLQDVGYLINYEQHHKHSYHLIVNSRLPGFRRAELEIIANVARYHRGSNPKEKHDNFRTLSPEERQRVRQLAGILRLAGGLDRSYRQHVRGLDTQVADGRTTIWVDAGDDSDVDLWSARTRAGLFEKAFSTQVAIRPRIAV